jgi:hypothetical protein
MVGFAGSSCHAQLQARFLRSAPSGRVVRQACVRPVAFENRRELRVAAFGAGHGPRKPLSLLAILDLILLARELQLFK